MIFFLKNTILLYFDSMISIILPSLQFTEIVLFFQGVLLVIRYKVFDEMPEPHLFLRIPLYASRHTNDLGMTRFFP